MALGRKPTENLEAYELSAKGSSLLESMSPRDLDRAERCFRAALALDPGLVRAHVGVGLSHLLRGYLALNVRPSDLFPPLKKAAEKALALDPENGTAHVLLSALALYHEWDWATAESEIETALELGGTGSWGHGFRGYNLMLRERYQEAEASLLYAMRLDPLSPLRCQELAQVYAHGGRPEKGVALLEELLRENPSPLGARIWVALCHLYSGNTKTAGDHLDLAIEAHGRVPMVIALRGVIHQVEGATRDPRGLLDELLSREKEEYVDPYALWTLGVVLDGLDGALPFLEMAINERAFLLPYLRISPRFRDLRADPRFLDALRTVWPEDF
jgi:tetratricopeptide (TPR) repeat protein